MRQFCYVIVGVVGVLFAVTYKMTAKTTAGSSTKDAAFSAFQRNYLIVYILMVAGDWLQGPYVYALCARAASPPSHTRTLAHTDRRPPPLAALRLRCRH